MIVGNDVSSFQGNINWPVYKDNTNFVIAKATEGIGYIDAWFGNNRQQARNYNLPRGWYHFARPDLGNKAVDEANYFLNILAGDPLQEGEILVLDFEVNYNNPVSWCKAWLDYIQSKTGVKPLIYLNQSQVKSFDWSPVKDANYGLYIAAYTGSPTNNNFATGAWPSAVMQQWTSSQQVPGIVGNCDGDCFFGDVTAFKTYGYKKPSPPVPPPVPPTPPPPTPPPVPPTPPPPPPPPANCDAYISQIDYVKSVIYGKGFWWTKIWNLKAMFPKS